MSAVPRRADRGCQIPWSWRDRWSVVTCILMGVWKLNRGPLEEQKALLTADPSHQPYRTWILEGF